MMLCGYKNEQRILKSCVQNCTVIAYYWHILAHILQSISRFLIVLSIMLMLFYEYFESAIVWIWKQKSWTQRADCTIFLWIKSRNDLTSNKYAWYFKSYAVMSTDWPKVIYTSSVYIFKVTSVLFKLGDWSSS